MIHILVVDDDKKINQTVCAWLNDCGFEAKGVLSATEAYDEMYNQLYELIISDIMMPEVDGFAFARTVREVNKRIPILFMSAKDDLPSKQKGFQLGIDDYMVNKLNLQSLKCVSVHCCAGQTLRLRENCQLEILYWMRME